MLLCLQEGLQRILSTHASLNPAKQQRTRLADGAEVEAQSFLLVP